MSFSTFHTHFHSDVNNYKSSDFYAFAPFCFYFLNFLIFNAILSTSHFYLCIRFHQYLFVTFLRFQVIFKLFIVPYTTVQKIVTRLMYKIHNIITYL